MCVCVCVVRQVQSLPIKLSLSSSGTFYELNNLPHTWFISLMRLQLHKGLVKWIK